jgi:hypothetical protein
VTDPRIHDLLAEPLDDPDASLTADAELVLRHVAVATGILETVAPEYLRLRERALAARAPDAESTVLAVELAGALAAVGRSARAHPLALEAARAAGLRAIAVLDVLDELLASLVLVTDPGDLAAALTPAELEQLLGEAEITIDPAEPE